jgi:hypothetical protein
MALPYSTVKRVWTAAAATNTFGPDSVTETAAVAQLYYTTTGFSGTLDIQGSMTYDGVYQNLLYTILATGAMTHAVAQISHTTNTAQWHILIHAPMPFIKIVMTRSAGSITADLRTFSAPFNIPAVA